MNLGSILKRSLALLLVLASLVSLVPAVFAEDKASIDNIYIEVPDELKDEAVVEATFGENGEIIYRKASEETISAVNGGVGSATTKAITDASGNTIKENRAGNEFAKAQRLAFFIDPANTEGNSDYSTYTLSASIIKNLVAAGVTDLFVMVKPRSGGTVTSATVPNFSLDNLQTANTNKGSAKVYAWVHCARDAAYLKKYKESAQYHFRVGFNNIENGGVTDVSGWVNLEYGNYVTYMEALMRQVTTYADGILLDSVRFGTEYTGWGQEAKDYMGKTNYNNAVKAMCVTAGSSKYSYSTGSDGFYVYKAGSAAATGDSLATIITNETAAATSFANYRQSTITNFIGKMKTAFGSSKIIAVALERDYDNTTYQKYVRGQNPYNFRNHVKYGFCVTMQVRDYHSTDPAAMAKKVAYYTNVMVGVDFYKVGTVGNYGYTYPDTITDVAESIFTARYTVAKTYKTYRGYILGAACYTAGHVGAVKASLSNSGTTPKLTATVANPNAATYAMLTYFNKHGDTDCGPQTTNGATLQPSGSTMQYYSNTYEINSREGMTGANIKAFASATIVVNLQNYTVDWDKLPFIRFGFYVTSRSGDFTTYADTLGYFPIYIIANHASCTQFKTTWISAEANCTTKGFKQHECTTCKYTYIEEVAKLGHSYTVQQSVTQPTCTAAGSKVMKCSRCTATQTTTLAATGHSDPIYVDNGSNHKITCSKCDRLEYGDHTYSNGVCTLCGHVATKFLHFKANSAEITWTWQMSGGGTVSYNTSGNGIMYGTSNGSSAPAFYVDAASADKIDHPITAGDVVQIRLRITDYNGDPKTVASTVSFDTGSGSFGTALSGDTISLNKENTDWQTVTIPISGYTGTIEQIKVAPFGDISAAAKIEIDYIYIGETGRLPITVTFVNYDGSVLAAYPIDLGASVTYSGPTPIRPIENNFKYTFKGWKNGTAVVDLSTEKFNADTTLIAYYDAEYADPDHISSSKTLKDDDGDTEDYTYDLVIDAYSYGEHQILQKDMVSPMDITIVFDRSASIAFPAVYSDDLAFPNTDDGKKKLTNYLKTLTANQTYKNKQEGYFVASNYLCMEYTGKSADPMGKGTCSYEAMKYMNGDWYVWQTAPFYDEKKDDGTTWTGLSNLCKSTSSNKKYYNIINYLNTQAGTTVADYSMFARPSGVIINNDSDVSNGITMNFTYHQDEGVLGRWVKVTEAYDDFYTRMQLSLDYEWVDEDMTDVYFRIGVSRRGLMQDAIGDFIDSIYETDSKIIDGSHHKISVVSYGYGTYVKNNSVDDYKVNHLLGISTETSSGGVSHIVLDSTDKVTSVKNILNHAYSFGSTYTDNALTVAKKYVDAFKSADSSRQRVLILMTDGAPTHGSNFESDVANAALATAEKIKASNNSNAKIFSIGFMPDIDSNDPYTGETETDYAKNANNFLHLVSSNYPTASNMTTAGTGNSDAGFYYSTADGEGLANHFAMIFNQIKEEVDITTAVDSSIILYDVIKREWDVNGEGSNSLDITVQRCDYLGNGEFAAPTTLSAGSYAVGDLKEIPGTGGDRSITIEWKDAPNAWLRETPLAGQTTLGYKILVTIGIKLDRDSTIGGNNIPTNGPDPNNIASGAYYPDIQNPTLKTIWEIPNVNVEPLYDYQKHDFFMDLYNPNADIDLLRTKYDSKVTSNNSTVFGKMYTITQSIDGLNNRFVSLEHYLNQYTKSTIIDQDGDEITTLTMGDSLIKQVAASGASGWTDTVADTVFDFARDSSLLTAGYKLTMKNNNFDSLGRPPFGGLEVSLEDGIVNYYAPKYAVLDFGTKVEVPLVNEAEIIMDSGMSKKIALSDDGMSLTYNFEDGSVILDDETGSYSYKVSAINAPKGASDNNVYRTFTVLPANNVMYEETYLTNVDNWAELGKLNERTQSADCTTAHGYDSGLHELGLTEDYSFGHAYYVEASAANNNKAMTFSFTGTGFDVLSRTGPEDGVMVVEIYTDKAMTNKVATKLTNNYLKEATLYQVPVVRVLGLDHGTYYVKIRAYYWDGFNANYSTSGTSSTGTAVAAVRALAQTRICTELGITAEEMASCIPVSANIAATRNGTTATDNSYEVVVDGIRIYNPLGTISKESNPEAYYVYGLAEEINPTFYNARDLLLDSKTWSFDGEGAEDATGMAYVAATGSSMSSDGNVDGSSQVPGIHLSMDGSLKTEKGTDGKTYLLDTTGTSRVQVDGRDVYVRTIKWEDGRETVGYFILDAEGKEVNVGNQIKITYYNSNYDVNGPKNEIYLNKYNGVAFQVVGEGRVMVGASSSNGNNVFLQVYSESDKEFVDIYAHQVGESEGLFYSTNRTELYYDITDYVMSDGTVVLRAPNGKINNVSQNGTLAISGIKVIPADGTSTMGLRAPVKTVQTAVELIQEHALPEITVLDGVNLGEQLALENDLSIMFRIKEAVLADYDLSTAYLIVERDVYGTDGTVSVDVQILRDYTIVDGRVVFTYTGISAAQMNDEIRMVMHIFDQYGNEYITAKKTTSVAFYLKSLLESVPTGQDELYTLIMDMLNYGTAAQMYFNRHTDAPANKAYAIFDDYASYASTGLTMALEDLSGQIANEGATAKLNQALDLGTRVGITYKVTLPEGVSAEDATLVVKDAEGNVLDTLAIAGNDTDSRGRYLVTFYGSTSRDMRRVVYATVMVDGAPISNTYTYSISTYAWGVYMQGASDDLIALTQAMIIYGDSAYNYFN